MRTIHMMASAIGAALSPFGLVTAYLILSRLLPDSFVFPLWLGVLVLGVGLGVFCLCHLTADRWRRLILSLVYVPVMFATTVVYSFYVTGALNGAST